MLTLEEATKIFPNIEASNIIKIWKHHLNCDLYICQTSNNMYFYDTGLTSYSEKTIKNLAPYTMTTQPVYIKKKKQENSFNRFKGLV